MSLVSDSLGVLTAPRNASFRRVLLDRGTLEIGIGN